MRLLLLFNGFNGFNGDISLLFKLLEFCIDIVFFFRLFDGFNGDKVEIESFIYIYSLELHFVLIIGLFISIVEFFLFSGVISLSILIKDDFSFDNLILSYLFVLFDCFKSKGVLFIGDFFISLYLL